MTSYVNFWGWKNQSKLLIRSTKYNNVAYKWKLKRKQYHISSYQCQKSKAAIHVSQLQLIFIFPLLKRSSYALLKT